MLITTVTCENKALFESMAQAQWFDLLELPGRFVLGAIDEDDQGQYAAGVLVFEVEEISPEEDAYLIAGTLRWLYVEPQARGRGVGDALMEEFFRVIGETGGVHLALCDVPMDAEYNELCAFLEDWGFTFSIGDVFETTLPLGELLSNSFFSGNPGLPVVSLSESPSLALSREIDRYTELPSVRSDLPELLPFCDMDVSCALWDKLELKGLMLVLASPNGSLEPLLMRSLSSDPRIVMGLARFAGQKAKEKYPMEKPVRLVCRTQAASSLISFFLPDMQPLLMRRGVCDYAGLWPQEENAPELSEQEEEEVLREFYEGEEPSEGMSGDASMSEEEREE